VTTLFYFPKQEWENGCSPPAPALKAGKGMLPKLPRPALV